MNTLVDHGEVTTQAQIRNLAAAIIVVLGAAGLPGAAMAEAGAAEPAQPESGNTPELTRREAQAATLEKIATMTSNPLGAAWMLWLQNDTREIRGDLVPGGQTVNTTVFQPVMSFPFDWKDDKWNFIVRPVLQYQSVPLDKRVGELLGLSPEGIVADPDLLEIAATAWDDRTNGLGDTALLTMVGPARDDGLIWGVGASQIFPTAAEDVLGQGKWQAGPAALFAKLAPAPGGWNMGAFAQHWWSYAGDSDRASTSQTDIQYFINYRLTGTSLVGMSPNIRIDWKADSSDKFTVPIGLGYSNVYMLGRLPVRVAVEAQYSVIAPDNVGSRWNFRLLFIPVIPNPFAR
jgi:hypothetical protein